MPKSKTFPSAQLQSYLKESRAQGSVPPFATATDTPVSTKQAALGDYLASWGDNWKRLEAVRYVPHMVYAFDKNSLKNYSIKIFGVPLTPQ
jgi:hypothetical protein